MSAKVRRKKEEELLGRVMTRAMLDLSSMSNTYPIPSLHDDSLQLLYSSQVMSAISNSV